MQYGTINKNRKGKNYMSSNEITKKILSYIDNNLDKDLSLEKVSKELNYSKFYIARVFKENTGHTLYRYIQNRRLAKAAKKLVETTQPIIEIALEAGYSSQQAFTKAFRYEYICTPQEYRRIGMFVPKQNEIHMKRNTNFISCSYTLKGGKIAA